MDYLQLLFSELRLVPVRFGNTTEGVTSSEINNDSLLKAVTANEEILALGYTLSPKDIALLAGSPDLDGFVQQVRNCIGDVKAKPMYPGFPEQVMEMDEAVFRFHQMLHYMSTYGIELMTGSEVSRGWLPEDNTPERTEPDDTLLAAKTVSLISRENMYKIPYIKILSHTERMDDKQRMIVLECLKNLAPEDICGVTVSFKQNMLDVFNTVLTMKDTDSTVKLGMLRALCQHTGDVWKCMDYSLTRAGFHFRTSQKRLIVRLLESYPLGDFRENMVLSAKKADRTSLMLRYLDYGEYSRKTEYAAAVAEFREGKLRSWESRAKFLAESGSKGAPAFYAERPGMMLRSLTYLMRKGYSVEDISLNLMPKAGTLKTQTIVSLLNFFSRPEEEWADAGRYAEAREIFPFLRALLKGRLRASETVLAGKKVYVDCSEFDLDLSEIRVTDKSSEGGYIRSGLAYKIPENVERMRFFVYWNDENRVDVDLHGAALSVDGEPINIGWNTNFKTGTLVFSGDITHSDAAEYFDIDLVRGREVLNSVSANINLYSGYDTFGEIDECYVGAMAVNQTGEEIKLYDPKNCFFTHYLTSKCRTINYGWVDVQNRVIVFDGTESTGGWYGIRKHGCSFSLSDYLNILLASQQAERVASREDADTVLVMGKPSEENEVSLIDSNFFMEG